MDVSRPRPIGAQLLALSDNNRRLNQQAIERSLQGQRKSEQAVRRAVEQRVAELRRSVELGKRALIDVKV